MEGSTSSISSRLQGKTTIHFCIHTISWLLLLQDVTSDLQVQQVNSLLSLSDEEGDDISQSESDQSEITEIDDVSENESLEDLSSDSESECNSTEGEYMDIDDESQHRILPDVPTAVDETSDKTTKFTGSDPPCPSYHSYKLVGDNIDLSIKPRYMRYDRFKHQSLHYFHMYAVQNRINVSDLCRQKKGTTPVPISEIASSLLPSKADGTFAIFIARTLVDHLSFFSVTFSGISIHHTPHKYAKEMLHKSIVVSNIIITCMYVFNSYFI